MVSAHLRGSTPLLAALMFCLLLALAAPVTAGATTELHIKKLASDGVSIIDEKTVDYRWLEANLPIQGDGRTHYYHQGPIFELAWEEKHPGEPYNFWNPEEDINILDKDMGAVKGTDLKDICELVGGMGEEDTVRVRATDGMSKMFPYRNVYEPESRQGPMVITWYRTEDGYVPNYYTGMRLVFFADTSTNPYGIHAFGAWDMHECFDERYWYYFQPNLPTTTGLSVQYVSDIIIYSEEEPVGSIYVNSTPPGATVYIDDEKAGNVTPCNIPGIEVGTYPVRVELEGFAQSDEKWVTVRANTVTEVEFHLTPETGKIDVSSVPDDARIYLDGIDTGKRTDTTLEDISVGKHTILLVKPDYRNATQTVTVEMDTTTKVRFDLTPENKSSGDDDSSASGVENGSITITSVPANASIYLDGNRTGLFTDATLKDLPPGEHTIKLVLPGYLNMTRTVTVEAQKRSFLDLIFENATPGKTVAGTGRVAVSSVPANASIYLDGNATGVRTNATLEAVPAGRHTIGLMMPGYRNATKTIIVEESEHIALDLVLSPTGEEAGADYYDEPISGYTAPEDTIEDPIHFPTGEKAGANTTARDEPTSGRTTPANPIEGFIGAVLGFLGNLFSIFGIGGSTTPPPEPEITQVPVEHVTAPVPTDTPAPPVQEVPSVKNHSGGLYVDSYPPGMRIVVDNEKLVRKTPGVIYGLREGLHTVTVEEGDPDRKTEDTGYRFEAVQVWVYPDTIAPAFLDSLTTARKRTIRIDSNTCRGERFTVNGLFPAGTIPGNAGVESVRSWITVLWNGTYISYGVPYSVEEGGTFTVEPEEGGTVPVSVDSSPPGAAVFIDGFSTGMVTPCQVDGLSFGQHRIMISKVGYIPAEKVIRIPEGAGTGDTHTFALREYVSGDLLVESTVPDAKIYLYGRYTGEKAPHTFSGMSIGTYKVRAVSENASRTVEDVLVTPGETTLCRVVLEE